METICKQTHTGTEWWFGIEGNSSFVCGNLICDTLHCNQRTSFHFYDMKALFLFSGITYWGKLWSFQDRQQKNKQFDRTECSCIAVNKIRSDASAVGQT